ncbi:MAG: PqqD family protein [Clostridia bacterium]|nr:PqqD family protein [Clostridia bacterium]
MKIKDGYLLKEIAGNHVVIPVGALDFDGMISLNETGVFLWRLLEKGCTQEEAVEKLLLEYEVSEEIAEKDVGAFLEMLKKENILHE